MGYDEGYNKLNSFYLRLWGYLDQFFPEDRWLNVAPPPHPELGLWAERLTRQREAAALGDKLDKAFYGVANGRTSARVGLADRYLSVVLEIESKVKEDYRELKAFRVPLAEFESAEADMKEAIGLLSEYGKMQFDVTSWRDKAHRLRERLGDKALEYSRKIYSSEEEVWKGRAT